MNESKLPVALVTGASRGIGRGIAVQLAESGFSVAINYRSNQAAAEETIKQCKLHCKNGKNLYLPIKSDISIREEREKLVEEVLHNFGRIDVLINNAGIAPAERKDILNADEDSFEKLIRVNLQGPYFLTQRIAQYWLTGKIKPFIDGGFKIVFISSLSAEMVSINRGEYCISKAGLSMAAKLWAIRLAQSNIQVYEVRPGLIDTDMTSVVREKYNLLIKEGNVPQKRWGYPEDVGKAVRALVESNFNFSSGSVIYVDGGLHISVL